MLTHEHIDIGFEQFMDTPETRRLMMLYTTVTRPDASDMRLLLAVAFAGGFAAGIRMMIDDAMPKETLQ